MSRQELFKESTEYTSQGLVLFLISNYDKWSDFDLKTFTEWLNVNQQYDFQRSLLYFLGKYLGVDLTELISNAENREGLKTHFQERASSFYYWPKIDERPLLENNLTIEVFWAHGSELRDEGAKVICTFPPHITKV